MFLKSLILKSKAERTHLLRGVKVFYPCLSPPWREFRAILVPLPPRPPLLPLNTILKLLKKKKRYFKCCPSCPTLRSQRAVANARIQRSLHLSGNPQTALSGCARWNMPFSGLGLIFGSKGQLAPRPRRPGTPAPGQGFSRLHSQWEGEPLRFPSQGRCQALEFLAPNSCLHRT